MKTTATNKRIRELLDGHWRRDTNPKAGISAPLGMGTATQKCIHQDCA